MRERCASINPLMGEWLGPESGKPVAYRRLLRVDSVAKPLVARPAPLTGRTISRTTRPAMLPLAFRPAFTRARDFCNRASHARSKAVV